MTALSFFGCFFTAYGPILTLFFGVVLREAPLMILTLACSFTQLLSILLASILWYIVKSLQLIQPWNVGISVMFQEILRVLLLIFLGKAKSSFESFTEKPLTKLRVLEFAFAGGIGYGITSSALNYINPLVASLSPGIVPCTGCPGASMYYISAITAMLFSLLHCCWMVLAVVGAQQRYYQYLILVIVSHFGASYLTLLQVYPSAYGCVISIMLIFGILLANAYLAAKVFKVTVSKSR